MSQSTAEHSYSKAEVTAWLSTNLPHWHWEDGTIQRIYVTSGWKATMMAANAVAHLAEAAWHHPDMVLSYAQVTVRLSTHTASGVTEKDYALARKIEEVVNWQPAKEHGALEGTPQNDPKHAYIKYTP